MLLTSWVAFEFEFKIYGREFSVAHTMLSEVGFAVFVPFSACGADLMVFDAPRLLVIQNPAILLAPGHVNLAEIRSSFVLEK